MIKLINGCKDHELNEAMKRSEIWWCGETPSWSDEESLLGLLNDS